MKTADLQDFIYTTPGDNLKVNFNKLFLFVPKFIPDAQTQIMFNDSIKDGSTLSFDSWTSEKKTVDTQLEYQSDIGSAQNNNCPKFLIAIHQAAARIGVPNKANNIAIFDHVDMRKHHIDIDGNRYPKDSITVDYGLNDYVDQYRDLNLFYRDYGGEEIPNPFISYPDMKNKYPLQLIDPIFQVDQINLYTMGIFVEHRGAINNGGLFIILIRHREITNQNDIRWK